MTSDQVKQKVVTNALTGYLRIVIRMGLGLVTFRLLYQAMSVVPEQFGFWSLLWAVFGYGILLDFGFGYSAQKRVAELSVRQDWPQLSRVLSSIFFFYLLTATMAVTLGLLASGPLIDLFKVSAAHREEYRRVMMVFLVGIGLAFPLGIFPEVLQGQQRIATANNISICGTLMNFGAVVCVVWFHWSFMTLVVLSLLCILLPYLWTAKAALDYMPGVRLRPGLFSWHTMFDTGRFSVYAYANTLSNVMRNKTDQPVISTLLGVASVTPYQAGSKVGEMFGLLTRQIADVLSPTAAHLHARGDAAALRDMMINGMRFSVLAATPLYVVTAAYMDGVIRLLTGQKHPGGPMIWAGELLVFWYYSLVLTHWVFKTMFMMAGQEKKMMRQGVLEAVLNLLLSVGLTLWLKQVWGVPWGILGVALGSVIPTVVLGWGFIWGWAAREAQLSRWALFQRVILKTWLACVPMALVAAALRLQPWWTSGANTLLLLAESGVVAAVGLAGLWRFALSPVERAQFKAKLDRKRGAKGRGKIA
jgi:O-antigen/teichoic acid export membrane protein